MGRPAGWMQKLTGCEAMRSPGTVTAPDGLDFWSAKRCKRWLSRTHEMTPSVKEDRTTRRGLHHAIADGLARRET